MFGCMCVLTHICIYKVIICFVCMYTCNICGIVVLKNRAVMLWGQ
jgi:hypothetical protein